MQIDILMDHRDCSISFKEFDDENRFFFKRGAVSVTHFTECFVAVALSRQPKGAAWMIFRGYQSLGGEHERIK